MATPDRDKMLRELAQHRGFKLIKSRRRKPGTGDYGRFGLADAKTGKHCFGFGSRGLEATPEEVESFLRGKAKADWKSSLTELVTADAERKAPTRDPRMRNPKRPSPVERQPTRRQAKKAAPKPRSGPKPKPKATKPLAVRPASAGDAKAIAGLIATMNGAASPESIVKSVRILLRQGTPPLVAEQDSIVGCAAYQIITAPQHGAAVGRITLLFTAEGERRRGIGTALLKGLEAILLRQGCELIELVHDIELSNANSFLRRHGYHRHGYRFVGDHSVAS